MKTKSIVLVALAILLGSISCSKDDPFLTLDTYSKAVNDQQGSFTIQVSSNVSWAAISIEDWCTVSATGVGDGVILVNYDKNSEAYARSTEILISGYGLPNQTFTITQSPNPLSIGLLAYYPFNGNAMDESGNGKDGTINGASLTNDRKGQPNKAYSFNGTSNSIGLPNSIWSNELTISAWIYAKDFGSPIPNDAGKLILFKAPDTGYLRDFTFGVSFLNSVPKYNFIFGNSTSEFFNLENSSVLISNTWYNLTITRKNGVVKMYTNGVLDGSLNYSFTPVNHSHGFKVGTSHVGYQTFNGYIDDIRIYNRAITESEVLLIYNE